MKKVLLKVQYDGSAFHGWQRQPNVLTAQGELERVLSILCNKEIRTIGSSRTDRGVHAMGQIADFSGDFSIPIDNIKKAGNRLLNPAIQILSASEVDMNFHSIANTVSKTYRYRIVNDGYENPFDRNFAYYIEKSLDVEKMKEASKYIVGEKDFKCFQASGGEEVKSTVRTVHFLDIDRDGKNVVIEINGNGFLYKMVRNIVGTLIEVGFGKREPKDLKTIIESKDRRNAGHTAKAEGLYLKEIFYNI